MPSISYLHSMPLPPLIGHQDARLRLADAVRTNRLPQVILISGPVGVGKQRLALWLAQLVLCQSRDQEPCGGCRACRLVSGLAHADLHWFVPIPRPKAGSGEETRIRMLRRSLGKRQTPGTNVRFRQQMV